MEYTLIIVLSLCMASLQSSAQTDTANIKKPTIIHICAPSRNQLIRPPLYVIISKGKVIFQSDTTMKNTAMLNLINPQQIKSLNVIKDKNALVRYGDIAKNGVIEVILNDKKYPKAWKSFRPDSVAIKLKRDSIARSLHPDTVRYRR